MPAGPPPKPKPPGSNGLGEFLKFALAAVIVAYGVELVESYSPKTAFWLVVLILLSVLILRAGELQGVLS